MQFKRLLIKVLWFYIGLTFTSLGFVLIIRPGLGAAPWDILHLGFVHRTNLPLGLVIQLTGLAIILLDWLLRIPPSLGMFLNMLSMGPIVQWLMTLVPEPVGLLNQWAMLLTGLFISGIGIGLYASADLGVGPRDGLMLGLTRRLGISVAVVRNSIDVTVVLVGWWLGGPLGVGTILVALGQGPCVQLGLRFVGYLSKQPFFSSFVHPIPLKSKQRSA